MSNSGAVSYKLIKRKCIESSTKGVIASENWISVSKKGFRVIKTIKNGNDSYDDSNVLPLQFPVFVIIKYHH